MEILALINTSNLLSIIFSAIDSDSVLFNLYKAFPLARQFLRICTFYFPHSLSYNHLNRFKGAHGFQVYCGKERNSIIDIADRKYQFISIDNARLITNALLEAKRLFEFNVHCGSGRLSFKNNSLTILFEGKNAEVERIVNSHLYESLISTVIALKQKEKKLILEADSQTISSSFFRFFDEVTLHPAMINNMMAIGPSYVDHPNVKTVDFSQMRLEDILINIDSLFVYLGRWRANLVKIVGLARSTKEFVERSIEFNKEMLCVEKGDMRPCLCVFKVEDGIVKILGESSYEQRYSPRPKILPLGGYDGFVFEMMGCKL